MKGDFCAINVAALDGVSPEEWDALPIHYEDGRNNRWDRAPEAKGYL